MLAALVKPRSQYLNHWSGVEPSDSRGLAAEGWQQRVGSRGLAAEGGSRGVAAEGGSRGMAAEGWQQQTYDMAAGRQQGCGATSCKAVGPPHARLRGHLMQGCRATSCKAAGPPHARLRGHPLVVVANQDAADGAHWRRVHHKLIHRAPLEEVAACGVQLQLRAAALLPAQGDVHAGVGACPPDVTGVHPHLQGSTAGWVGDRRGAGGMQAGPHYSRCTALATFCLQAAVLLTHKGKLYF